MRLWCQYIGERKTVLVALAVFAGIFAVVFAIYDLPVQAVFYPALVCAFVGSILVVVRFTAWKRRHQLLSALQSEVTETVEGLPLAGSQLERDYQMLLQAAHQDKAALVGQMEKQYRDTVSYFSLWAHQIKTPISAMRLILREEESAQNRELLGQLQAIEQYVEMSMCYLRLDAHAADFVIRTYELDSIIRQVVKKYASMFIWRHIRLNYTQIDAQVLTDEKGLFFIIEQVLSNALKYTNEGGVISIYLEEPKTLCIQDTGIGIAAEDLPRIFECGYTGLNGRRDKKASGIGLYLCSRIAKQLGHTVSVDAQVGVGTVVRIGLDRKDVRLE